MKVLCIENGISIIPETEFETQYLSKVFVNSMNRKVVVKSGTSLGDIICLDVTTGVKQKIRSTSGS